MANLQVKDGAAATKYLKTSGVGDNGDPHIPEHLETNSADILTAIQAVQTAVEILDNIVSGSEAQVDIVSSALPSGASTATNQTTIIGHVDGIEGLLTTIDADTSSLAGAVAGTELQVDIVSSALPSGASTAANQTTIIGHVDGIEGLLTTMDADTSSLAGTVSGSELQVDVVGALPAGTNAIGKLAANSGVDIGDVDILSIAAGENHLGEVGGNGSVVSATFARPADTTAYAAKDAVSNSTSSPSVMTFSNVARVNQGTGYIVKARLMTDQSANTARFRLHLFHTSPTAINDNAAYTLLWANRTNRIGHIDFSSCQTEGSGSDAANSQNDSLRLHFQAASGSRHLYGLLETLDAFTPASGQNFYIELSADLN